MEGGLTHPPTRADNIVIHKESLVLRVDLVNYPKCRGDTIPLVRGS